MCSLLLGLTRHVKLKALLLFYKRPNALLLHFLTALKAEHAISTHTARSRKTVKLLASRGEVDFKRVSISHIATAASFVSGSQKHLLQKRR